LIVFGEILSVFFKKRRFLFPISGRAERKTKGTTGGFFGYIVREGRIDKGEFG